MTEHRGRQSPALSCEKNTRKKRTFLIGGSAALGAALAGFRSPALAQSVPVDPALPTHTPVAGISGSLKSIGSDTLNNLMTPWAEGFPAIYPNVRLKIEGKGSSTAPPALIAGTSQFGPMSRPMRQALQNGTGMLRRPGE